MKNLRKKLISILLILSIVLIDTSSVFALNSQTKRKEQKSIENTNGIPDPNFPKESPDLPYTLTVPPLDDRLSLSKDGKTATLFAPYMNNKERVV